MGGGRYRLLRTSKRALGQVYSLRDLLLFAQLFFVHVVCSLVSGVASVCPAGNVLRGRPSQRLCHVIPMGRIQEKRGVRSLRPAGDKRENAPCFVVLGGYFPIPQGQ